MSATVPAPWPSAKNDQRDEGKRDGATLSTMYLTYVAEMIGELPDRRKMHIVRLTALSAALTAALNEAGTRM
jgi:hypothetical protein